MSEVGTWKSSCRCESAGLMRPAVRIAAAAETVVPCIKQVARPPNAASGLKPSMSGMHSLVSLKDVLVHDGSQQVGPTKDVDQILDRLGRDVVGDAFQRLS